MPLSAPFICFSNLSFECWKWGARFLTCKAIQKNDVESVLFLLSIQVDVNSRVRDPSQSSPLHLAAETGNELIVRSLLLAGARVRHSYMRRSRKLCTSGVQSLFTWLSLSRGRQTRPQTVWAPPRLKIYWGPNYFNIIYIYHVPKHTFNDYFIIVLLNVILFIVNVNM